MAQAVVMPKFGQATEESTIMKWHKKEGDIIKKGDVMFEIETDKAVLEVESFFDGTLLKIIVGEGETVPVSVTVAFIGEKGEAVPDVVKTAPVSAPAVRQEARQAAPVKAAGGAPAAPASVSVAAAVPSAPEVPGRFFISPRAKALAKKCVIDPLKIKGTGGNGRVVERDVVAYLESKGYSNMKISPSAKSLAAKEGIDILTVRGKGVSGRIMVQDVRNAMAERPKTLSKMRQVIAQRLTQSFTTTPHFYVSVSADMTDLFAYRQELKAKGQVYTVTDFILEAVIMMLEEIPVLNSVSDGRTIRWHSSVDLGMAVALDDGLVVPVIKNATELNMMELHDMAKSLATRAKEGKLLPDEMTGSTFTVSNMGMLDVENFNAIINPGEAGILAVASTVQKVVVIEGQMKIRSMMTMTLSTDHRIVDGATGAAFVNGIKNKLEDIELWKSLT